MNVSSAGGLTPSKAATRNDKQLPQSQQTCRKQYVLRFFAAKQAFQDDFGKSIYKSSQWIILRPVGSQFYALISVSAASEKCLKIFCDWI